MRIFNNACVIGIGGGILSGVFVTFITRYLFSKKDNSEYIQKIATVKREILYALRPRISDGHISDESVLLALANSTATKYKVERIDIFQSKKIAEELIKEIMDSSFISSDTKKKYRKTLAHLVTESLPENDAPASVAEKNAVESDYRQQLNQRMGMTAAQITMLVAFQSFIDKTEISSPLQDAFDLLLPTMTILTAIIIAMAAIMLTSVRLKRLREQTMQMVAVKFNQSINYAPLAPHARIKRRLLGR